MPPPRTDPTTPSTTVQKRVMCMCITDFEISPARSPITKYQIMWNILLPPYSAFGWNLDLRQIRTKSNRRRGKLDGHFYTYDQTTGRVRAVRPPIRKRVADSPLQNPEDPIASDSPSCPGSRLYIDMI